MLGRTYIPTTGRPWGTFHRPRQFPGEPVVASSRVLLPQLPRLWDEVFAPPRGIVGCEGRERSLPGTPPPPHLPLPTGQGAQDEAPSCWRVLSVLLVATVEVPRCSLHNRRREKTEAATKNKDALKRDLLGDRRGDAGSPPSGRGPLGCPSSVVLQGSVLRSHVSSLRPGLRSFLRMLRHLRAPLELEVGRGHYPT